MADKLEHETRPVKPPESLTPSSSYAPSPLEDAHQLRKVLGYDAVDVETAIIRGSASKEQQVWLWRTTKTLHQWHENERATLARLHDSEKDNVRLTQQLASSRMLIAGRRKIEIARGVSMALGGVLVGFLRTLWDATTKTGVATSCLVLLGLVGLCMIVLPWFINLDLEKNEGTSA